MAVSNRRWSDFAVGDYTGQQWKAACLVDRGVGDPDSKGRYAVPVREPNGDINRQAVLALAKGGGAGMAGLTDAQIKTAGRRLVRIMKDDLQMDPPEQLLNLAGLVGAARSAAAGEDHMAYRSFASDLHVRSGGDGRTLEGIVVPYSKPVRIDSTLVEQFEPGVFAHQMRAANRVKVAREHMMLGGTLIGAGQHMEDTREGLFMQLRVARTPVGDETLELVRDGALDELSVMFRERQNRRLGGGVVARVKADLLEVAVVLEGAYGRLATVTGVRSAGGVIDDGVGEPADVDIDLHRRAERYLTGGGLPAVNDPELRLRALRLGMPAD